MNQQTQLDGMTAICAVGGAIASAITQQAAAAAFPLAGAVMLQIFNRKQLLKEISDHRQNARTEIIQSIESLEQQHNDLKQALELHKKHNEQVVQNQSNFSEQLQLLKQDYLTYLEKQNLETEQLQSLINAIIEQNEKLETEQQVLKNLVDDLKQIEKASQVLQQQNSFKTFYERALSYQHIGKLEQAIVDFNQAIQLNPHYAEAYHQRGLLRAHLGEHRAAASDLRYAAKYYFDQGDLENYKETRSLSKQYYDGMSEAESDLSAITQQTFEPLTANHLFEIN